VLNEGRVPLPLLVHLYMIFSSMDFVGGGDYKMSVTNFFPDAQMVS